MRAWLALPVFLVAAVPALALAPAPCANLSDPALLADPSAELQALLAAGWKVEPLIGKVPAPLPEPGEPQADGIGCSGIRPGSQLVINGAWLCTANWIYQDELDAYYMGTAGHCAVPGDSVTTAGVGRIGDVVFSTGNGGVGNDFALVKVYPQHYDRVIPSMCRWGGPIAVAEDNNYGYSPVPLVHYGFGALYGETPATRARAGAIHDALVGGASFEFGGTIAPGDSGSAIQFSTGHVVGVITHGLIAPGANVGLAVGLGTRVQHGLALAEQRTGHQFEVAFGVPVDFTSLNVP